MCAGEEFGKFLVRIVHMLNQAKSNQQSYQETKVGLDRPYAEETSWQRHKTSLGLEPTRKDQSWEANTDVEKIRRLAKASGMTWWKVPGTDP
jgi:hypothetical protein